MTNYLTQNVHDAMFNAVLKEDVRMNDLFTVITLKDTYKWAIIRNLFAREKTDITIVDRHAVTPLRCMLLASFCKEISEELRLGTGNIKIILPYLQRENPGNKVTANSRFDTTANRNSFLLSCADKIIGKKINLTVKRGPLRCRDITLSMRDFNMYIRVENGITEGWLLRDQLKAMLPPEELQELYEENLRCHNINMHDKDGILYNIELQRK